LLTISKIRGIDVLYKSLWGMTLSIKIILYIIMVATAIFVVLFVGPKLKKGTRRKEFPKEGIFGPVTLSSFDGKEGSSSFIAFKGNVYDVSGLKLWKNGAHMKHLAGSDLTSFLPKAPHGEEKLSGLKITGTYDAARQPPGSFAQKAFYFVAYMNLTIVFLVLFVIAYWRWGQ